MTPVDRSLDLVESPPVQQAGTPLAVADDRPLGDGSRRGRALVVALTIAIALVGAWRWWWAPREAAASEARGLAELRQSTAQTLADLDLDLDLDARAAEVETLRWRAPGECVEVYRLRVDERFRDASVELFVGRPEEHASYTLALAGDPRRRPTPHAAPVLGVLSHEASDEPPKVRELWWGPERVGPSAPDFACRRRSWDPLEDALALGWPELAPRPTTRSGRTWVGSRWSGAPVEGRCHETVCLDPDGSFGHAIPCRARPWTEQLAGAGGSAALIVGTWDDGHDPARTELGILTSRAAVIDEGRPLYVRVEVDHRWSGVRRELTLTRLDDCGSRSVGGEDERAHVEQMRAEVGVK